MNKPEDFIFKIAIKGKNLSISDVISYPASGLEKDKVYVVTVKEKKEMANPMPISKEEKEKRNRLLRKAFKKLETIPKGNPLHYSRMSDWDLQECPICGEIFFGLMAFASHTVKAHDMSASQVWKWEREYNPSRR